jgi:hypothetical protein
VIRCFLSLVSLALLSATAFGQCANGVCPVPGAGTFPTVVPSAVSPVHYAGPASGVVTAAPPVTERVVSLYPRVLRNVGITRVDLVFGQPMTSRTLATPFRGRFRR